MYEFQMALSSTFIIYYQPERISDGSIYNLLFDISHYDFQIAQSATIVTHYIQEAKPWRSISYAESNSFIYV